MVEIAELTAERTLKLPSGIAARFQPSDRFVIWAEGDTLYLKRVTPPSVLDMVDQAPEGEPMPLGEINQIVHQIRRQRRTE